MSSPATSTPSRCMAGFALLAVAAVAAFPATAGAAPPSGNSAIDQYREAAPSAPRDARPVGREGRRSLTARGRDGAALAEALDRNGGIPPVAAATPTASGARRGTEARSGSRGDVGSGGRPVTGASGPSGATAGATTGRTADDPSTSSVRSASAATVGPFPVWAMSIAAVVIVAAGAVLRRRAS